MNIYGKDFARLYNEKWHFFDERLWPFVCGLVLRAHPQARTWLDLCCGTGSLLRLLGENGFTAVGVDASIHQLRFARENAPRAWLVQADVRTFSLHERFDVVTCLFDSVNYLLTKRDLRAALHKARRHLAKGGCLVFDSVTPAAFHNPGPFIIRSERWTAILEETYDARYLRRHILITGFMKEGRLYRKFTEEHVQRAYTTEAIESILSQLGLVHTKYDGDTLTEPREESERLVYSCAYPKDP